MKEKETVYLVGAGINQHVNDWDGLKPPLANNFFKTILRSKKYQSEHYSKKVDCVYRYIEKYWKKSKDNLRKQPFNLEECYTFLHSQLLKALHDKNEKEYEKLSEINFRLNMMLAELLSEFEIFGYTSNPLRVLGKRIYEEKPIVISFNYDCILETAIESASHVCSKLPDSIKSAPRINNEEIPDEEIPYSHYNWNRPLGYGIKFDEVQLQRAGPRVYVDGQRFYNHPDNSLYNWRLLKLHGSLNWFQYLQIRKYPLPPGQEEQLSEEKLKNVILGSEKGWFNEPPDINGWIISPLIITPILYKDKFYQEPLFSDIWSQAKQHLEKCKRLIIIGYSFSPTDFETRKLLLEAFENNQLEELIVVNPDTSVVKIVKELTHFNKPVKVCSSLEEFL